MQKIYLASPIQRIACLLFCCSIHTNMHMHTQSCIFTDSSNGKTLLGTLDYAWLFSYALAMFFRWVLKWHYFILCYIYTYKIHSLNCNFLWTLSFKVVFNNFEFWIVIISMSQVMIVKLHHLNRKYVVQLLGTVMVRLRYGTDKFSQIGELVCFYYICVIVL